MAYFSDLTPEQQELAIRRHELAFRAALNRGSASFCNPPKDLERVISDNARTMAEDSEYSEREIRMELSVRTAENAR